MRSDDGLGPYIAAGLKSSKRLKIIDAADKPQNIIDEVVSHRPSSVLIIDAADFKGAPGEIRFIESHEIPDSSLSTHSIPLRVIAGIISKDTGCQVKFLGIQPKNVSLGEEMSSEVIEAAKKIIKKIKKEFTDA